MRKILLAAMTAAFILVPSGVSATEGPTVQTKVEICHNGHSIEVNINAVGGTDTGHGLLTFAPGIFIPGIPELSIPDINIPASATFTAHVGPGGHEDDFLIRVFAKAGNDETNLFVNLQAGECSDEPEPEPDPLVRVCLNGTVQMVKTSVQVELGLTILGEGEGCPVTTTTTAPPTTTTTAPPVTTTTQGSVTTVTVPEAPHVVCPDGNGFTFKQAPGPCPELAPAPLQPVNDELPRTGGTVGLAWLGAGIVGLGVALRRLFKR